MDKKEHNTYLKEFKEYSKNITSSKKTTQKFLVRSGINTPTGRLTKTYSTKNKNR
jgi:hypothetical protein